jgi:hypothetical protein
MTRLSHAQRARATLIHGAVAVVIDAVATHFLLRAVSRKRRFAERALPARFATVIDRRRALVNAGHSADPQRSARGHQIAEQSLVTG